MGSRTSRFLLALALLLSLLPVVPVTAQDSTTRTIFFQLAYVPDAGSLVSDANIRWEKERFAKEPDFGGRKVYRAMIPAGGRESDRVRMIWDMTRGRLWVDGNRNNDLTDDQVHRVKFSPAQTFHNVEIPFPEGPGTGSWRFHLWLRMRRGSDDPEARFYILSGWRGTIDLAGWKYSMTVKDNLDGSVGAGDQVRLDEAVFGEGGAPGRVFVNGRMYGISYEFDPTSRRILNVTFREIKAPMGACNLTGEFIEHLILVECRLPDRATNQTTPRAGAGGPGNRETGPKEAENGTIALFLRPQGTVAIPAGCYLQKVSLRAGSSGPQFISSGSWATQPILEITAGETVSSRLGAPLRNRVTLSQSGANLKMGYSLVGGEGEVYRRTDAAVPLPGFKLFKGARQIASGSFGEDSDGSFMSSWRVPPAISGKLAVVASAELGKLGPRDGTPTGIDWRFHWTSVLPFVPWFVVPVLLLVRRENRTWRICWLIVPVAVVWGCLHLVGHIILRFSGSSPSEASPASAVLCSFLLPLACVWGWGNWIRSRSRPLTMLKTALWILGVSTLCSFCLVGPQTDSSVLEHFYSWGHRPVFGSVVVPISLGLAAMCCGGRYKPRAFSLWLAICAILCCLILGAPYFTALILVHMPHPSLFWPSLFHLLPRTALACAMGGLLFWAIILPFLVLAFSSRFYRERLFGVCGVAGKDEPPPLPVGQEEGTP